jgi:hypothetical protein
LSRPPIPDWGLYPAKALSEQGFAAVACLFLGGAWEQPSEAEIAVAYDFLCDLYLATEREDVQRAAEYLGQCQSVGASLASSEVAEEESRKPPRGIDLDNPRALRAWQKGDRQRALDITIEARRRKEERLALRLADRRAARRRRRLG